MMQQLVECVPNISEGRDQSVISQLLTDLERIPKVAVLDVHIDPDHHRSVFTIVGEPEAMVGALFGLVQQAQQLIDIGQHYGEHPRIGVVDVAPWIPIQGTTMEDCVRCVNELGDRIGQHLEIPVFLYEEAASVRSRAKLEMIRRGGLAALEQRMKTEHIWKPDYGPPTIHPTAGAIAVGARFFLLAFNIVLQSDNLAVANIISKTIRTSSGGLSALKAIGVPLISRQLVQVSMNLTDYRVTSLRQVFEAVSREVRRYDVEILESEIVGLIPRSAWDEQLCQDLKLRPIQSDPIIESRLNQSSVF